MPQQNEYLSFAASSQFVSNIDYSEARDILELTTNKQKQLRRQRSQLLAKQLLLKRTYTLVCDLLDSDCCTQHQKSQCSPLSTVDTNKRKLSSSSSSDDDHHEVSSMMMKKSRSLMDRCFDITNDHDVLQFLRELNSVKVTARY